MSKAKNLTPEQKKIVADGQRWFDESREPLRKNTRLFDIITTGGSAPRLLANAGGFGGIASLYFLRLV